MTDAEKIKLLKTSLIAYREKWQKEIADDSATREIRIQRNAMIFMASWIINSINGGIDKIHGTNICDITLGK